ncbi:DNA mismatch repair endonuclease MutL [Candidatus Dependentiae bacterium]|nr:DNA mismatch repair endonuclease MutL [Candidatus Dependentiae bacterium]
MNIIKQLPPHEAQKIAAGEVVERPANIVKELLENSIDAGAKNISIYIKEGGKKLIKIVDDGCGMSEQDAKMSILHHTTSKISSVDDLETLNTHGFRGEALSSICSVSSVTLKTRHANFKEGTALHIANSNILKEEKIALNIGTEIEIQNIFDNVPARKKFLKTKETEQRAILQIFYAMSLNYFDVAFKFYSDDKILYNCPAVDSFKKRIAQIFDNNLSNNILDCSIKDEFAQAEIIGGISQPQFSRYDRNLIYFFVNSRWVKNYKLSQALIKGYLNILPAGKFPSAFIFIKINPKNIDVNIHPRKDEILFLHPRTIDMLIEKMTKIRLEQYLQSLLLPASKTDSLSITIEKPSQPSPEATAGRPPINFMDLQNRQPSENKDFSETINKSFNSAAVSQYQTIVQETQNTIINTTQNFKILGQLHKTYIILQNQEGTVFVDQHAAHERILYEKFEQKFNLANTNNLISPKIIKISKDDLNILNESISIFKDNGIEIEQFGTEEIVVKSIPQFLQKQSVEEIVKSLISILDEQNNFNHEDAKKILIEKMRAQMACKAAVKAGDLLTEIEMEQLVSDLYKCANRFTCPHGRPTFWSIELMELEKKFKRRL